MNNPVYLDNSATTPVDERVLAAMLPYFNASFGNPASIHRYGQQAEAAVENARELLADAMHCQPGEIVFTSCGSESDNTWLWFYCCGNPICMVGNLRSIYNR